MSVYKVYQSAKHICSHSLSICKTYLSTKSINPQYISVYKVYQPAKHICLHSLSIFKTYLSTKSTNLQNISVYKVYQSAKHRAGNLHIRSSLICSFAHFAQIKSYIALLNLDSLLYFFNAHMECN